jgi:hypothetical protein
VNYRCCRYQSLPLIALTMRAASRPTPQSSTMTAHKAVEADELQFRPILNAAVLTQQLIVRPAHRVIDEPERRSTGSATLTFGTWLILVHAHRI